MMSVPQHIGILRASGKSFVPLGAEGGRREYPDRLPGEIFMPLLLVLLADGADQPGR